MSTAALLPEDRLAAMHDSDLFVRDGYPHEVWTQLRAEAPVQHVTSGSVPFYAITRHEDIVDISRKPLEWSSGPLLAVPEHGREQRQSDLPPTLISMDPPAHAAFRQLISKRFTPRYLKTMHEDIRVLTHEIIDDLVANEQDEVDFVEKVSAPLPIAVIAWLLGVPREDWPMLFKWTNEMIGAGDDEYREAGETPSETNQRAQVELFTYFSKLQAEKEKSPEDDLISIIASVKLPDGRKLDPMEILTYYMIIVIAGNETTRNGTSGGMLAFIEHQDEMRRLQQNPDLLKPAIEEVLRWTSPIIHFTRTAEQDHVLHGQEIEKGEHVALYYPSANRDERVFDEPNRFRIDRDPNRHIAFGIGEHFCMGAHVARLELELAYKYLIPRIDEIELAGPVERLRSNLIGGIKHLPIRYKLKPATA